MKRNEEVGTVVYPREGETIDSMIRRFEKKVDDDGIMKRLREISYYEKPSVKRYKARKNK